MILPCPPNRSTIRLLHGHCWIGSDSRIRMQVEQKTFTELLNMSRAGKLQMFNLGYRSLEPSGYQILQTLWSRSPIDTNPSQFSNPDYDATYEQFLRTPSGSSRVALARKMSGVSQVYMPMLLHTFGIGN